jgi:hypothetical protein
MLHESFGKITENATIIVTDIEYLNEALNLFDYYSKENPRLVINKNIFTTRSVCELSRTSVEVRL